MSEKRLGFMTARKRITSLSPRHSHSLQEQDKIGWQQGSPPDPLYPVVSVTTFTATAPTRPISHHHLHNVAASVWRCSHPEDPRRFVQVQCDDPSIGPPSYRLLHNAAASQCLPAPPPGTPTIRQCRRGQGIECPVCPSMEQSCGTISSHHHTVRAQPDVEHLVSPSLVTAGTSTNIQHAQPDVERSMCPSQENPSLHSAGAPSKQCLVY